mgnify:CR=1 FL=1
MKKKIIALVLACIMCISVLVIPASANVTNIPSNMSHFINDVSNDFQAYRNGNISLTDFLDLYSKNCLKWGYNNVSDVSHMKDVLHGLQNLGVDVPEKWTKWFYENKMGGNGSGGNRDDTVLNGYGAVLKEYNRNGILTTVYYGEYGVFRNIQDTQFDVYLKFSHWTLFSFSTGELVKDEDRQSSILYTHYIPSNNSIYQYLGDWRNADGSANEDFTTELPEKVPPTFDDDSVSENDLIEFLDKLLEDLRQSYPDLSTLEGLLNAILAKLGTLDSDDDGQLLAEINTAIITLASDNHADNQAIISLLTELKESMKKGTATDLSNVEDKLSKIQKSLDYLCTINTIDTGVDLWKQLTETEKTFLSEYAAIITTLLPKFGLTAVNNVIMNMNSVLLNNTPPSDLTADVFGQRVTILSSNMFDGESMQYIDLAKTFISVLLIYSFCLILRRKIAGGGT